MDLRSGSFYEFSRNSSNDNFRSSLRISFKICFEIFPGIPQSTKKSWRHLSQRLFRYSSSFSSKNEFPQKFPNRLKRNFASDCFRCFIKDSSSHFFFPVIPQDFLGRTFPMVSPGIVLKIRFLLKFRFFCRKVFWIGFSREIVSWISPWISSETPQENS